MERERKTDIVVIKLHDGESRLSFAVEPTNESEKIDREYLKDLVEEAMLDALNSGVDTFAGVGDAVVFSLQNEGFMVRDFPDEYERLDFNVRSYLGILPQEEERDNR